MLMEEYQFSRCGRKKGVKIEKPTAPTREHATFLGWFVDGEEFDFETAIEENLEHKQDGNLTMLLLLMHWKYYEETLEHEWNPTEDVELIKEISGLQLLGAQATLTSLLMTGKLLFHHLAKETKQ